MHNRTCVILGSAAALLSGCTHAPPRVDGVASIAPRSDHFWTPPRAAVASPLASSAPVPADLADRISRLTLADVTDIALRNNPATRESWAQSRAAAYAFGTARTRWIPPVDASVNASRTRSVIATATDNVVRERTQYAPQLSLDFLVFDLGGRSGSIEAARQNLFAAGLTHNATVQNTVLQVQVGFFTYMATKGLVAARTTQLSGARANLAAAEQRHQVGLATIADVLQARTAVSQAQLALETSQGDVHIARGTLAAGMGLPANVTYDIDASAAEIPVGTIAVSVDSLIDAAVRNRPDLLAARAAARSAVAQIRVARAAGLPSLTMGGTYGRTYIAPSNAGGSTFGLSLGLQIPLVSAFTNRYDVNAARARADAATARADGVRQDVIQEVFTSYYALQTATQRVSTTDALLASAVQSEEVAAGRYREGVGSIIDLLTAQSALADARAAQVQARWQWSMTLAQLARDAGSLGLRGISLNPITTIPRDTSGALPSSSITTP
jgi:outer membrane protein